MGVKEEMTEQTDKAEVAIATKPDPGRDWFEFADFSRLEVPEEFRSSDRSPFEGHIRVEQQMKDDSMVIRAELPDIDPDKDVDLTVTNGMLCIKAEWRDERKEGSEGPMRSEFRYGSYTRALALPKGASGKDVKATYKDGILEVTVPFKQEVADPQRIAITRG